MEAGSDQAGPAGLTCQRHGQPTRITCVTCDTPICPACAIRTEVGLKCPDHATKPAPPRPPRFQVVGGLIILLALDGFIQLARTTGRGEPATPPCPTETAPDVGIGSEGGPHWTEMSPSGLCGRYHAAHVWTGTQLLIWGGENCAGAACPTFRAPHLADGAAYTPSSDAWRRLPPSRLSARAPAATAWTGTEMLVWGGVNGEEFFADGAAYDPARDRWRRLAASPLPARDGASAVWTGRELLVWGGGDLDNGFLDGAAYDPAADSWRKLPRPAVKPRFEHRAAWTGSELFVFGGTWDPGHIALGDGAVYDPRANRWRRFVPSP